MPSLVPESVEAFLREGGPVVVVIFALSLLGWGLLLRQALLPFEEPPVEDAPVVEGLLQKLRLEEQLANGFSTLRLVALFAAAAPLLGLLGTVLGMMDTFEFLGHDDVPRVDALAEGVSKALITTQTGLVVAILLLAGHGLLERRLKRRRETLREAGV